MPSSDTAAVDLLKGAWNNSFCSDYADVEIINRISEKDALINKVIDFAPASRQFFYESFFDSMLAKYPRRTTEVHYRESMECEFPKPKSPIYEGMSKIDLELLTDGLILEEMKKLGV